MMNTMLGRGSSAASSTNGAAAAVARARRRVTKLKSASLKIRKPDRVSSGPAQIFNYRKSRTRWSGDVLGFVPGQDGIHLVLQAQLLLLQANLVHLFLFGQVGFGFQLFKLLMQLGVLFGQRAKLLAGRHQM